MARRGLADSLSWFADRGHQQIVAWYYDSGDGASSAASEAARALGTEGPVGATFTAWYKDQDEFETWAEVRRARERTSRIRGHHHRSLPCTVTTRGYP